jgi:SAM-dependent methyltransferase
MSSVFRATLKYIATLPPFARFSMQMVERYRARQARADLPLKDENGVPVPDALLMMTVVGHTNWPQFQSSGAKAVETFADLVTRNGGDFSGAERIMDFGCGCGRLARHLPTYSSASLVGVDYNRKLIAWCAANLAGTYIKNELQPPVNLPDAQVEILYALSIFTHLREETQIAWLGEFARLLKPGGFALVTFHDATHKHMARANVSPEQLAHEGIAYYNNRAEGSNLMSTFQSTDHVRALASAHFEVCELIPSNQSAVGQAIAVLRRK